METITVNRYIQVICPVCKARRVIQVPKSIVNKASQLTTISVPQGKVCRHHFQLFVDKNFSIRGYQKVDYQLNPEETKRDKRLRPSYQDHFVNSLDLHQSNAVDKSISRVISENHVNRKTTSNFEENFNKKNKMTLKEIYDEFWELIDDKNEIFRRFIDSDKERRMLLKMRHLNQHSESKRIENIPKN